MWIVECSNPKLNRGRGFAVWQSDLHEPKEGDTVEHSAADALRACVCAENRDGVEYRLKYVKAA